MPNRTNRGARCKCFIKVTLLKTHFKVETKGRYYKDPDHMVSADRDPVPEEEHSTSLPEVRGKSAVPITFDPRPSTQVNGTDSEPQEPMYDDDDPLVGCFGGLGLNETITNDIPRINILSNRTLHAAHAAILGGVPSSNLRSGNSK